MQQKFICKISSVKTPLKVAMVPHVKSLRLSLLVYDQNRGPLHIFDIQMTLLFRWLFLGGNTFLLFTCLKMFFSLAFLFYVMLCYFCFVLFLGGIV